MTSSINGGSPVSRPTLINESGATQKKTVKEQTKTPLELVKRNARRASVQVSHDATAALSILKVPGFIYFDAKQNEKELPIEIQSKQSIVKTQQRELSTFEEKAGNNHTIAKKEIQSLLNKKVIDNEDIKLIDEFFLEKKVTQSSKASISEIRNKILEHFKSKIGEQSEGKYYTEEDAQKELRSIFKLIENDVTSYDMTNNQRNMVNGSEKQIKKLLKQKETIPARKVAGVIAAGVTYPLLAIPITFTLGIAALSSAVNATSILLTGRVIMGNNHGKLEENMVKMKDKQNSENDQNTAKAASTHAAKTNQTRISQQTTSRKSLSGSLEAEFSTTTNQGVNEKAEPPPQSAPEAGGFLLDPRLIDGETTESPSPREETTKANDEQLIAQRRLSASLSGIGGPVGIRA